MSAGNEKVESGSFIIETLRQAAILKEVLVSGLPSDGNGRYQVGFDAFTSVCRELYDICLSVNSEIKNGQSLDSEIDAFKFELFCFRNLNLNIDRGMSFGAIDHGKIGLSFDLTFLDCAFGSLHVRSFNSSGYFFKKIILKQCNFMNLNIVNRMSPFRKIEIIDGTIKELKIIDERNGSWSDIQFTGSTFLESFSVNDVELSKVSFSGCFFGSKAVPLICDFNNATMSDRIEFKRCTFYAAPSFHGAKFHSGTSFVGSKFHGTELDEAVSNYRVLRQAMSGLGSEHDALMFHALEMDARRQHSLPKFSDFRHPEWVASFCSHFLKLFNDYGRNYRRPFIWLSAMLVFFFALYLCLGGLDCNGAHIDEAEIWEKAMCRGGKSAHLTNEFLASLIYSSQRSFGPLGLIIDSGLISAKTGLIKILSIVQIMLCSIIWYLIIVQIRR